MPSTRTSPAVRILRRSWAVCLCAASCGVIGGRMSSITFVAPASSRLDFCGCQRDRTSYRGRCAVTACGSHGTSYMSFEGSKSRVGTLEKPTAGPTVAKNGFVVYTGFKPESRKGQSRKSKEKLLVEQMLGEKVSDCSGEAKMQSRLWHAVICRSALPFTEQDQPTSGYTEVLLVDISCLASLCQSGEPDPCLLLLIFWHPERLSNIHDPQALDIS